MRFLTNVDFNRNQILKVKLQNSASDLDATTNVDAGWIYYNTAGHIKFFNGTSWITLTDSNTTVVDKYVQSGEILRGTWSGTTFTPSAQGSDLALKLTYNSATSPDPTEIYIDVTSLIDVYDGANLLLTSGYSIPDQYTAPAANDSMDTVIGKLMKRIDTIVATGGEPNTIDTVKVNGSALTPDANKAVDVLIQACYTETGHNGDIKVNNQYVKAVDLSSYSTATPASFMAHGLIQGGNNKTTFTVTHTLNCTNPSVTLYDNKSGEMVMANVTVSSANAISVNFAVAPTTGEDYDVFIVGYPNASVGTVTIS